METNIDLSNFEIKEGQVWKYISEPHLLLKLSKTTNKHVAISVETNLLESSYGIYLSWKDGKAYFDEYWLKNFPNWVYLGTGCICFKCQKVCRQSCIFKG